MSSKKRKSLYPFASTKVSKTLDQNWADALAASDKGSCFEQEKLVALNKEDTWNFLSITSLVLSPFKAV